MNRLSFGKLVKALREESRIRRPDGHKVTQEELAVRLLSIRQSTSNDEDVKKMHNTLARIEQGKKKYIDPTLLADLANEFELTSRERTQFFLASTGIERDRQPNEHLPSMDRILDELAKIVAQTQSPTLVVDFHGDIVMFNYAMLEMYGQSVITLRQMPVFNLLLAFFELSHAVVTDDHFEERLIQNIQFIRANSLLHRNDTYFVQLLDYTAKRHSPQFSYYWQCAYTREDMFTQSVRHSHHRHEVGRLDYMNSVSTTITQLGTLSQLTYVPLNRGTSQVFLDFASREGVIRNPAWPACKERGHELFG